MAAELRCPECRAKLRLAEDPDPGTEIACPKCDHVFLAPDPDTGDAPDRPAKSKKPKADDDDAPKKKKKRPAGDDDDAPKKKKPPADKKKASKKRRAKKKETNKAALVAVIGGGLLFLCAVIGLLAWYFTRVPVTYEMMKYLPDDCDSATGLNVGHIQKYKLFFEKVEPIYQGEDFKGAADAAAKALGTDTTALLDTMVHGHGPSGRAVVLRTKEVFDPAGLAQLPGAREATAAGRTYYTIGPVPNLRMTGTRVFAPTDRLIVFCDGKIPQGKFEAMLTGNEGNYENTLAGKAGPLAKRVARGTYWTIQLFDAATRPKPPAKDDPNSRGGEFQGQVATTAGGAKGYGFKASVGSRAVRFEVVLWCADDEKPKQLYDSYKESDLAKGDEVEPPRWWKDFASTQLTNKKVAVTILSNLGVKRSGELFIVYSECDTVLFMEVVGSVGAKLGSSQQNQGGG